MLPGQPKPLEQLDQQETLDVIPEGSHGVSSQNQGPKPVTIKMVSTISQTTVTGINTFHPSRMIWS